MSRIGKKPIPVPPGVEVAISGNNLVKVKKGSKELSREFDKNLVIKVEDGKVIVERTSDDKQFRALHGLTRSLIANMVQGVETGFVKTLELVGVGYRATKQGNKLVLSVGYSHPVEFSPIEGIDFEVETPTKLHIKGIDKQLVGQVAANIRSVREPEPYKGKGIKYSTEVIRRKAGKTGKKK